MAITVAQVINHARDLHPALSAPNAPNPLIFRALSRMVDGLFEEIARRVPAFLAVQATVTFPLPSFVAGIDLTTLIPGGWKDLLDGFCIYSASSTNPPVQVRASFIPFEQRDMNSPLPAFTLKGNTLFFLGQDTDYANFASFVLSYTPLSAALTGLTSTIPLPDDALDALAPMLAGFLLQRLIDDPQYTVTDRTAGLYKADGDAARKAFLTRIFRTSQRQDYVIRDVLSGR